jgi:hypothetical protein
MAAGVDVPSSFVVLFFQLSSALPMESDTGSSEMSSALPQSLDHHDSLPADDFTLTKDDIEACAVYLDEFQEGDADRRNTIVANAMADIVILRPVGAPFDKLKASKVIFIECPSM